MRRDIASLLHREFAMSDREAPLARATSRKVIIFCWEQFGPYHYDRLLAATESLRERYRVVGLEIASKTAMGLWRTDAPPVGVTVETLFPGQNVEALSAWQIVPRLVRRVLAPDVEVVFFPGYHRAENLLGAIACRLSGRRAMLMTASKQDDFPRRPLAEAVKAVAALPYGAALVGGRRGRAYLRALGFSKRKVALGYDSVSMSRMVQLAGAGDDGAEFVERPFLAVARLVGKKNLPFLVEAHSRYLELAGTEAHPLVIAGEGPERGAIEDAVRRHRKPNMVRLTGALQSPGVARLMRAALALCLPSTVEQWGLVINEALFLGLPVLASVRAGATDLLVEDGVNGFVLEPTDLQGWAAAMLKVASSPARWSEMSAASLRLAPRGDTSAFVAGVRELLGECG